MLYFLFLLKKIFVLGFGSLLGNVKMRLWGCKLCGPVRCFGIPYIEKSFSGKLYIGKNVCLRSSIVSNVAGCFHPVVLGVRKKGTLRIGNGSGISSSVIVAEESVTLGERVLVGVNCVICDTDFHSVFPAVRQDKVSHKTAAVVIEDDVWLGMNVTVLKGVTIGHGSVIAAGSIVTKDIPPNCIAGGNPAKWIRNIENGSYNERETVQ